MDLRINQGPIGSYICIYIYTKLFPHWLIYHILSYGEFWMHLILCHTEIQIFCGGPHSSLHRALLRKETPRTLVVLQPGHDWALA